MLAKSVLAFLRVQARFLSKPPALNISEHLANMEKVLVCMPGKLATFETALSFAKNLQQGLSDVHLSLLVSKELAGKIKRKDKMTVIEYSDADTNFLGLPNDALSQRVSKEAFDLVLDLNCEYDPFTILIGLRSNAPLRACLHSEKKAPFFNIGIRTAENQSVERRYDVLEKYLLMLHPGKEPLKPIKQT